MWLYLTIFSVPLLFLWLSFSDKKYSQDTTFLAIYLAFLALFVGMSDMFGGYDRYIYGEIFDNIADVTTFGGSYLAEQSFEYFPSEKGYTYFMIFLSFFTENRYIFILILTLIVYTLLFFSLKEYCRNYPLGLVLFLGLWFYFTFTYLRQVLGASIAWLSIRYIIQRKPWKFLAIMLVVISMHKSAVVFLPMYFIPVRKYKMNTVLYVMAAALIIGVSPIPNALFHAYGDVSQIEMRSEYSASGGFRVAYILEAGLFLYIINRAYDRIPNRPREIVLLNMALVFCAILLFFIRSENGGRLSWYYMIGIISTLTYIGSTGAVNIRKDTTILLVAICLFQYVRIYRGWQVYLNLYPYKTFLTNGYRKGDYSFEIWEYDYNYVDDKLYREPFRFKPNLRR